MLKINPLYLAKDIYGSNLIAVTGHMWCNVQIMHNAKSFGHRNYSGVIITVF